LVSFLAAPDNRLRLYILVFHAGTPVARFNGPLANRRALTYQWPFVPSTTHGTSNRSSAPWQSMAIHRYAPAPTAIHASARCARVFTEKDDAAILPWLLFIGPHPRFESPCEPSGIRGLRRTLHSLTPGLRSVHSPVRFCVRSSLRLPCARPLRPAIGRRHRWRWPSVPEIRAADNPHGLSSHAATSLSVVSTLYTGAWRLLPRLRRLPVVRW